MVEEARASRLGRGLSALLGDDAEDYATLEQARGTQMVAVDQLAANRFQPRKTFDEDALNELSASIREKGVLQPLLVRPSDDSDYEIIAGERRWRAAQMAGVHEVPVIIKDITDAEMMEIALIENVQRQDLGALEEAHGYKALIDEFDYTQEQLSRIIGKSRSHIANALRLLTLPDKVQALVNDNQLTAGHARTLINAKNPEALADKIIAGDLTVRQAEDLSREASGKGKKPAAKSAPTDHVVKDADTLALEQNLTSALGFGVTINHRGDHGGEVRIAYKTLDQLDDICQRLTSLKNH